MCVTFQHFFLCRHFEVGDKSAKDAAKLFSVPDFVGDACKAIASRIRGAVAGVQFDDFHKVKSQLIQPSLTAKSTTKIKNKSLYLSVKGSSTRVLIGDTFQIELEFRNVSF